MLGALKERGRSNKSSTRSLLSRVISSLLPLHTQLSEWEAYFLPSGFSSKVVTEKWFSLLVLSKNPALDSRGI